MRPPISSVAANVGGDTKFDSMVTRDGTPIIIVGDALDIRFDSAADIARLIEAAQNLLAVVSGDPT